MRQPAHPGNFFPGRSRRYSAARIERQRILHPEEEAKEALYREDRKSFLLAAVCLAAGIMLAILAGQTGKAQEYTTLTRPGYGEAEQERILHLLWGEDSYEIPLTVMSRSYTEEEWETLKIRAWEEARRRALGENPDWEHVRKRLDLSEESVVPGIDILWTTSEPELIDYDGSLGEESEEHNGESVLLTAVIRYEDREWEQQVTAVLDTLPQSEEERARQLLTQSIREAASQREEAEIALPEEALGQRIRYQEEKTPAAVFVLLGMLAAAACLYYPEQKKQEEMKKREQELRTAYPEMVSTLTVLMGAGLTVRGAWERMVLQYRRARAAGGEKKILYEEMLLSWNALKQGAYEEQVYREFGKRCGLQSYLRLGSLLETNIRKGSRGLIPLLKEESAKALEERLRGARREGEEISSRLLVPMLILFALVLVLLMAPAMMSM